MGQKKRKFVNLQLKTHRAEHTNTNITNILILILYPNPDHIALITHHTQLTLRYVSTSSTSRHHCVSASEEDLPRILFQKVLKNAQHSFSSTIQIGFCKGTHIHLELLLTCTKKDFVLLDVTNCCLASIFCSLSVEILVCNCIPVGLKGIHCLNFCGKRKIKRKRKRFLIWKEVI